MNFDSLYAGHNFTTAKLPNGDAFLTNVHYTLRETSGVTVLVATSVISCLAVLGLLLAISLSAFNTRSAPSKEHLFVRTHVAAYFICLLACDLLQAVGSLINIRWISRRMVEMGPLCEIQGGIKQAADVGAAIWSLIIAIHTFNALFLELEIHTFVLYATLIGGWAFVGTIVFVGPATTANLKRGPFFGISGYWCWISPEYPTERIALDYMIMFLSAFFCFILYTLIFLRLRGNILIDDRRIRFRFDLRPTSWMAHTASNTYKKTIARRMLLYPIAYFTLILPIAICRFHNWTGHSIPFEATIFSAVVYLLSGLANVVLFSTTRRILPPRSIFKFNISAPKLQEASTDIPPSPSVEKGDVTSSSGGRSIYFSPALVQKDDEKIPRDAPILRRINTDGSDTPNSDLPSSPGIDQGISPFERAGSDSSLTLAYSGDRITPSISRASSTGGWSPSQESPPILGGGGLRPISSGTTSIYSQAESFALTGRDSLTEEYARLYRSDTVAFNQISGKGRSTSDTF